MSEFNIFYNELARLIDDPMCHDISEDDIMLRLLDKYTDEGKDKGNITKLEGYLEWLSRKEKEWKLGVE